MKEYIIAYFTSPNKYGNMRYQSSSKKEAFEFFKAEYNTSVVLNIIEL